MSGIPDHEQKELNSGVVKVDLNDTFDNLEMAREEWDAVINVIPSVRSNGVLIGPRCSLQCDLIAFNEALQFFQTTNMHEFMKNIRPTLEQGGLWGLFQVLCGPSKLSRDLVDERNLVFAIAACPLDNKETVHMRVLQTVYKQLMGDLFDCPRYGRHWELIGFQGSDPATDLRGAGFWGLMNLLHLVMCPSTLLLACSIYKLSLHETQNFPFVVMSINITAIVLQVLREGKLNKICNRRKQVIAVVNDYYVAVFLHLYLRWKNEHKTISHSGFILKDVEEFAKRNPKTLLKMMESYLKESSAQVQSNARVSPPSQTCSRQVSVERVPEFSIWPDKPIAARPPLHQKGSCCDVASIQTAFDATSANRDYVQNSESYQNGKLANKYEASAHPYEGPDDEMFI